MAKEENHLNGIKAKLAQYYGTESYHRHFFNKKCLHTDGFKAYMELAKCFWLFDIIATEFFDVVKLQEHDKYYIKVEVVGTKATITMRNYKNDYLYTREVGYTDHPKGEIEFPFGWDGEHAIISLYSED
jgi:hypothetical protein